MLKQSRPFIDRVRRYFHAYGGWSAVLLSPLFLLALTIAALSYGKWLTPDWIATAQALLPNLLGFSLGTYSILFSLVTNRIKKAMKSIKNERGVSRLEEVNASFFHFIFVQVIALAWAFVYSATAFADLMLHFSHQYPVTLTVLKWAQILGSFVGYLLMIYSFLLILGAALAVYRLALITDPKAD